MTARVARVVVPVRTVSESNDRVHWRTRAKRVARQRFATLLVLRASKATPRLPLVVTLTRIAPRLLDDDNLRGALKGIRDQTAAWLSVDDRDPRVTWAYAQDRGAVRQYAVGIAWRRAVSS